MSDCTLRCGHKKAMKKASPRLIGHKVQCPTCKKTVEIVGVPGPKALSDLFRF